MFARDIDGLQLSRVKIRRRGGSLDKIMQFFLPWAEMSTARRGEVGTLLSQKWDVMEKNVTS